MWRSSRLFSTPGIAVLVVLLVGSSAYALPALADWDLNRQIDACSAEHSARAIDCWYGLINAALEHDGITGAMEVFSKIYEQQPLFASTGCHKHAHFVGDQVYYKLYRGTNDIRAIDFPQSSTACGYGIFHGFMEHLIQDNPDIPFVTEICTYLKERYSTVMGDIGTICYHGSGHGLMLAEAERVPKSGWGLVSFFTSTPARTCEALPEASSREIEECREGVYNVLVDWMEQTQYGFAYDEKNPFRICETEPRAWHQACYYEMAQKLDRVSSRDPVLLATLVSRIQDPFLRDMSFSVGIAGIMQTQVVSTKDYMGTLNRCAELPDQYFSQCVASMANGLMEHGSPQKEYARAQEICELPLVSERGASKYCWREFTARLARFYDTETRASICSEVPSDVRSACLGKARSK